MTITPIETEKDYRIALARIEALWNAPANSPEETELGVLAILVEAYEEEHYPMPELDPVEAIIHEIEALGLTRRDLEKYIGSKGRVSEVLNRKRPLSLKMIRRLNRGLGISTETLIQPYPTGQ